MKKVKKNMRANKNKLIVPIMIVLFAILAISVAFLIYIYTQNYIIVEHIDNESSKVKSEDITSVSPIIINNVVVGGVTDKGKWVNKNNIYSKANISKGTELNLYSKTGKMGTFEIYSVSQDEKRDITYVMPLKDIADKEYIAIESKEKKSMSRKMMELKSTEEDIKYVKKALGKYRLLNNTVKVNEVYEVYLEADKKTRIISATSSSKNIFGVYSVVVAVSENDSKIIKYSYVKNTESSVDWPVYSIKFACDLNDDNNYELIIQEAREFTMKYSILENRKNKYYEVIGLEFKI